MILISISDKNKFSAGVTAEALYAIYADILGIPAQAVSYTHNADGSPRLEGADVSVSVSHSGGLNAVALSDKPCGIDIEKIREVDHTVIASRFGLEIKDERSFFEYFSSAEAFAKASGIPLTEALKNPNADVRVLDWIDGYSFAVYGEGVVIYCPSSQFLP